MSLPRSQLASLPKPTVERALAHARTIAIRGYERSDGLFDVEGHLTDVRAKDVTYPGGGRPAGHPIHSMWLRLIVDGTALIVDVNVVSEVAPFDDVCGAIAPAYKGLIGVRVGAGFRGQVKRLLAGTRGCTHQTELVTTMATAVLQTLAGSLEQPDDVRPFQLDGCHALATDGPQVAAFYPRWVRKSQGELEAAPRDLPSGTPANELGMP